MTDPQPRRAPAAGRAIEILDLLADAGGALGVSEMARRLGLPKSSVFGICETLAEAGVLHADARGYCLTAHCLRWSGAYLKQSSLVTEFQRLPAREERLAPYTLTLSTLRGPNVVYLDCRNANRPLGFTFQVGMQLPAVLSATGKAMLACLPWTEAEALVSGAWPAPFTPFSLRDPAALKAQLAEVQARGYAIDDGEIREGMVCLGAAIPDGAGGPVAGIALSLTSAEARPARREALGLLIRDLALAMRQ